MYDAFVHVIADLFTLSIVPLMMIKLKAVREKLNNEYAKKYANDPKKCAIRLIITNAVNWFGILAILVPILCDILNQFSSESQTNFSKTYIIFFVILPLYIVINHIAFERSPVLDSYITFFKGLYHCFSIAVALFLLLSKSADTTELAAYIGISLSILEGPEAIINGYSQLRKK